MNASEIDRLRHWACTLLIVVAAGAAAGRILSAELVLEPSLHKPSDQPQAKGRNWPPKRAEPMPTFSSNDRSRWATVRALVDNGTYVVGRREYRWTDREVVALFAAGNGVQAAALAQAADRNPHDSGIIF